MTEEEMLEEIESAIDGYPDQFSEWELEFIGSVREQVDSGRCLSERQKDVINNLYANKVE